MSRNKCLRRKSEVSAELAAIDKRLHKLANRLESACKTDSDPQLVRDILNARLNLRVGMGDIGGVELPLAKIAAAAQEVYDAWEQDADGVDEEFGVGGICDVVADAVAGVLSQAGIEASTRHYFNDNHTVVIAQLPSGIYEVDIPLHLYERGSWYRYTKIPGVKFTPEHVTVVQLDPDPSNYDLFLAMD